MGGAPGGPEVLLVLSGFSCISCMFKFTLDTPPPPSLSCLDFRMSLAEPVSVTSLVGRLVGPGWSEHGTCRQIGS